jgi:hypothetical protein
MIKAAIGTYIYNLIYAVDVLANVILGGDRRDTISSRLGKGQAADKPVHTVFARVVDGLFVMVFNETDHCKSSIANIDDRYAISSVLARHRK